ncbi:MAG: LamG-like jellyroll fold domain-containing protein [Planctomycetota bacterium]|jgi:hypothetical protein
MKKTILLVLATNLGPTVNSSSWDNDPIISLDGLSLFFHSQRGGGYGGEDIWVTTRASKTDPWDRPVNLGPTVNRSSHDYGASISADGLSLFFTSDRSGGYGYFDLWVTTRATIDDDWGTPVNLGPTVNTSAGEVCPVISADGLTLFFGGYSQGPYRPGGFGMSDLWVTTRETIHDPWKEPVNLGPTVNSASTDYVPSISADGMVLFFGSDRPGGYGQRDIWVTMRAKTNELWREPVNLGPTVNSLSHDYCPSISSDGLTLFFGSDRPGGSGSMDLWQASLSPVIDFNGDGIVDAADMCIMVDHWGENYSLCDIGPTPLGDGIVDVQDLIVLSEYFFEELNDPTLAAHWALDETEGMVAQDSAAGNNGYTLGDPVWLPDGGLVDGALELDGVDDYIITFPVLNPANGHFSVLAWIKGGLPGQVVIAQQFSANWLLADPIEGNLMTELKAPGRSATPLLSDTTIVDGEWHRIGLVWDGSSRTLYVDSISVAQDMQNGLEGSGGGLHIGTGNTMQPGTYFSGLIDDVRIYNRVVIP